MNIHKVWNGAEPVRNWPLGSIAPTQYDEVRAKIASVPKDRLSAPPIDFRLPDWDGNLSGRRIDITAGDLKFECFGTPSGKKKLFVFLSSKIGRGKPTTGFDRVSWHPWLNGVCLSIDDSTRQWLDPEISAGWYFGSRKTHALPLVAGIVSKVQAHYGIANEDVCFVGSSSGGFAALWLADAITGATAVAGHPQFYALNWPSSERFALVGVDLTSPEFSGRANLDHLAKNRQSRFFVTINAKSVYDYKWQLSPLLKNWKLPAAKYGLNIYGNLNVYCRSFSGARAMPPHHALDDVHEFRAFLDIVNLNVPTNVKSGMLNALHEMQNTRLALADRVFFEGHWAEFLSKLKLPVILPQINLDTNTARFALKNCNRRVFYQVAWSVQGKEASISLRTKRGEQKLAPIFQQLAASSGAKFSNKDSVQILSLGTVRYKSARQTFEGFVNDTAPSLYSALGISIPSQATVLSPDQAESSPIGAAIGRRLKPWVRRFFPMLWLKGKRDDRYK